MSTESDLENEIGSTQIPETETESFSFGKFLASPMEENGPSLFQSWLQNRFREHFLKLDELHRRAREQGNFNPIFQIDESDVCFDELKLINIQEDHTDTDDDPDEVSCIARGIQLECDHNIYETAIRRIAVTFQRSGITSQVETLHILLDVGEVRNVRLFEKVHQPFLAYSGKHAIDIFRYVFPAFQGWIYAKNVEIKLAIPTSYYARYEEHTKMDIAELLEAEENYMSKLAAALKISQKNVVVESHRVLILDDVIKQGFQPQNSQGSSFLPLTNVVSGLKEIAKIHAVSWAFSKTTNKNLNQHWPFLSITHFLPFINSLVMERFPILATLAESYLVKHEAEDKVLILQRLRMINKNLANVIKGLNPPNATKASRTQNPVVLIHHGVNYTTTLFRHTTNKDGNDKEAKGDENSLDFSIVSTAYDDSDLRTNKELCIVDWKFATYGSPMYDVASFLLTSLAPKTRRRETTSLLKVYSDEFEAIVSLLGQSENISWKWDDLAQDYEKGLLYACLLLSSNVKPDSLVSEDDMEVFVEAFRDANALQIV